MPFSEDTNNPKQKFKIVNKSIQLNLNAIKRKRYAKVFMKSVA